MPTAMPRSNQCPAAPAGTVRVFLFAGSGLLALWLLALLLGPALLEVVGLVLNPHGHAHVYAHGHPFADARVLWGVPNAMDVLSNLPMALAGGLGLWLMRGRAQHAATRQALWAFFSGLVLTCMGSAWYHFGPDAAGLVFDRLGMAVTFAGALALAVAERVGAAQARATLWLTLLAGMVSAILPLTHGHVMPWAVVQFGGVALLAWAAMQAPVAGALGVRLGGLIGLYALAKMFELGDAFVFQHTGEWFSGHSLKHLVAALAAWPVLQALRTPRVGQNALATGRASKSSQKNNTR